jgi:hypothetical protein
VQIKTADLLKQIGGRSDNKSKRRISMFKISVSIIALSVILSGGNAIASDPGYCPNDQKWNDALGECVPIDQRFSKERGSGRTDRDINKPPSVDCRRPGSVDNGEPRCVLTSLPELRKYLDLPTNPRPTPEPDSSCWDKPNNCKK